MTSRAKNWCAGGYLIYKTYRSRIRVTLKLASNNSKYYFQHAHFRLDVGLVYRDAFEGIYTFDHVYPNMKRTRYIMLLLSRCFDECNRSVYFVHGCCFLLVCA